MKAAKAADRSAIDIPGLIGLRRFYGPAGFAKVLTGIESAMRAQLTHPFESYSITSADGAGFDISEADLLRVYVIRCCGMMRAEPESQWAFDALILALNAIDPLRREGAATQHWRATGGAKGARSKREDAGVRDAEIMRAVDGITRAEGRLPKRMALARMLADRGLGGAEGIRKRLARILPS